VQTGRLVKFFFQWSSKIDKARRKFDKSRIILTDNEGNRVQFESFEEDRSSALDHDTWFGDVARVELEPVTRRQWAAQGQRFVGTVMAPPNGFVQAVVPPNSFCSMNGLCNPISNQLRVVTQAQPQACVQVTVETATGMYTSATDVPFTFTFSSDMKDFDFNDVRAYGFSYEFRQLPSLPLEVSHVTGGPRQFVATVAGDSNPRYNRIEVFIRQGSVSDTRGVAVCESNHWRMAIGVNTNGSGSSGDASNTWTQPAKVEPVPSNVNPHTHLVPDAPPPVVLPSQSGSAVVDTQNIADEAITHDKLDMHIVQNYNLFDGAVTTVKIANNAILPRNMAPGAVTKLKVANDAVGAGHLQDGAVTHVKVAPRSVRPDQLVKGSITSANIGPGAVTSASLADGAVTVNKFAPGSIGGQGLADGSVTSKVLAFNSVSGANFPDGSITAKKKCKEVLSTPPS
jgi:hypothetical protein